jgi:phage shock protein A
MSIAMTNRVIELEKDVSQMKDMIRALYEQINELTKKQKAVKQEKHK